MLKPIRTILSAAAATGLAVVALTGPAQAADSSTVVDGSGAVTDDWGDNFDELGHSLCDGCAHSSNTDLVLMWQTVLFAEGLLPKSGLDGDFGPTTASATRAWQRRFGLGDDGMVGDATWGAADDRLRWNSQGALLYDAKVGDGYVYFVRGGHTYGAGSYDIAGAKDGNGVSVRFLGADEVHFTTRTIYEA